MKCTRLLQQASSVSQSKPYGWGWRQSNQMKMWSWLYRISVLIVQFLHIESGFTFQSRPGKGTVCLVRNQGPSTLYWSSTLVTPTKNPPKENWSILTLKSRVMTSSWQFFLTLADRLNGAASITLPQAGYYLKVHNKFHLLKAKNSISVTAPG